MTNGASSTRRKRPPSRRLPSPRLSRSTHAYRVGGTMPEVGGIAGERLRSFIERIERLEEEKRTLAADIKEVYAGALGLGVDLLDVGRERALFLLEPLDPLDERAQPLAGNPPDLRHRSPYPICVRASAETRRRQPSARRSLPSGAACAIRHTSCRRRSRAPRGR